MITHDVCRRVSRSRYEEQKKSITRHVNAVIESEIGSMLSGVDPRLVPFLRSLWDARKVRAEQHGRLRDMTVYLTLQLCGVNHVSNDHLKVMAAGELYNMASYYQNWHLDDKKSVHDMTMAKLCHIASHLYREQAHALILETALPNDTRMCLLREISESNKSIQVGQSLELAGSRIVDLSTACREAVVTMYRRRCYSMSGRFYGCSFAMGAIMSRANEQQVSLMRQIGEYFGTGAQMINDVGDFCLVPSLVQLAEKDYQDQFADLRKGTMTLPIYELSQHIDIERYHGRALTADEKDFVLKQLVAHKCFHSTRLLSNGYYKGMKHLLSQLPRTEARDMFSFMIGTFFYSNKFYRNLRENHGYRFGKINPGEGH
jgi:geranylgeranyl pyrophosphate synthase